MKKEGGGRGRHKDISKEPKHVGLTKSRKAHAVKSKGKEDRPRRFRPEEKRLAHRVDQSGEEKNQVVRNKRSKLGKS